MLKGSDCLSICLTNAEEFFGNLKNDYEIYFSFGKRKVMLDKEKNYLFANSHSAMEDNLENKGIHRFDEKEFDTTTPQEFIKKRLSEKKVLIISMKSNLLHYRSFFANNGIVDHYLLVTDYSDDGKIYVVDGYSPNEFDDGMEGWIEIDEVMAAWEACRCKCFVIERPVFNEIQGNMNISSAVLETITSYLSGEPNEKFSYGEKAIREWLKEISERDDLQQLIYQIKITGFLSIKQYLYDFLQGNKQLEGCAIEYKAIINGWQKICLLLFQMNLKKRYNRFDYIKTAGNELIDKEHELLIQIKKCFGE